jgi:hypothetical protein
MFFHLTTERSNNPLLEKAHQYSWCDKSFKPHVLYLDKGWTFYEDGAKLEWRKGYSLESKLEDIEDYEQTRGHFCIIRFYKSDCKWSIRHDNLRGFPIFYTEQEVTNLPNLLENPKSLKTKQYIELKDKVSTYNVNYRGQVRRIHEVRPITMEKAIEKVTRELLRNINDYLKYNNNDICVDETAGYDISALQAIMNHHNIPYTRRACIGDQLAGGDDLLKYMRKNHWGYNQLSLVPENQALVTGYMGDEFLMRNPGYVSRALHSRGIALSKYVANVKDETYMIGFIRKNYMQKIADAEADQVHSDAAIIGALQCDWQMWHYHNQITVLPFKSRKIINYGFGLSTEDILDQQLNVRIQKSIIEKYDSALLKSILPSKNDYEKT